MIGLFNQEDLQDTINSLPIGVVYLVVEPDNRFTLGAINDAAKSLFQSDENPVGRAIEDWNFPEDVKTRMQRNCAVCVKTGEMLNRENPFPLRDGTVIWSSNNVVPVKDDVGQVTGLLVTTVDITELVDIRRIRERELASLASRFVKICAWCNSIEDGDRWVEVDKYLLTHPSSAADTVVCPDCNK